MNKKMDLDSNLVTSRHLYQPAKFICRQNVYSKFLDAVERGDVGEVSWDVAGLLSMLSFGFVVGNRTLLSEVKRQPWLSSIDSYGNCTLERIPDHGFRAMSPSAISSQLETLLSQEMDIVCRNYNELYILLSGGLDSRIVAGLLAKKFTRESRSTKDIVAVTWGNKKSRDVVYGQVVAERLGFRFKHLDISTNHLRENISVVGRSLGSLVSPIHLHRMPFFKTIHPDALVLAGSYGDSVGRSEYSGRSVLELTPLTPKHRFELLRKDVVDLAKYRLEKELISFAERSGKVPNFVRYEHEQQGHYMRSMISQAMNLINHHCTLYQMFTAPSVYKFMWSIHPSFRVDQVYTELLSQLGNGLASIPWARTNRPLRGRYDGKTTGWNREYHEYSTWCCQDLYEKIRRLVDPDWFESTGVFNGNSIDKLNGSIQSQNFDVKRHGKATYELWTWLASLRMLHQDISQLGLKFKSPTWNNTNSSNTVLKNDSRSFVRRALASQEFLHRPTKLIRRFILRKVAKFRYPPEKESR